MSDLLQGPVQFVQSPQGTRVQDLEGRALGWAIKVNLPDSRTAYQAGNGEGCWVLVDDRVKGLWEASAEGGTFGGWLLNDSTYYPDLVWGSPVTFELRGEFRPVARLDLLPGQGEGAAFRRRAALRRLRAKKTGARD